MAIPGILLQMARSNPQLQQIKNMMGLVKAAKNPAEAINHMVTNNPQFKQIMDVVNQYGGDSMKAFKATAEKMGINPEDIMGMLK